MPSSLGAFSLFSLSRGWGPGLQQPPRGLRDPFSMFSLSPRQTDGPMTARQRLPRVQPCLELGGGAGVHCPGSWSFLSWGPTAPGLAPGSSCHHAEACGLARDVSRFGALSPSVWSSLVAQSVKNLPAMQETQLRSLGREDPLEKEMAAHSRLLAWRIPWTEESGGLQSMGLQESDRV